LELSPRVDCATFRTLNQRLEFRHMEVSVPG
jgi:hypothetical protein